MTYREQLNKLEELGITACSIEIANAEMIYLKSDTLTTDAIAMCINDLITKDDKTVDEILGMDKWDFSGKACYYLD